MTFLIFGGAVACANPPDTNDIQPAQNPTKQPIPDPPNTPEAPTLTEEEILLQETQEVVDYYTNYYGAERLTVRPLNSDSHPSIYGKKLLSDKRGEPMIFTDYKQIFIDTNKVKESFSPVEFELFFYYAAAMASITPSPLELEGEEPVMFDGFEVSSDLMGPTDYDGRALTYAAVHLTVYEIAESMGLQDEYLDLEMKMHSQQAAKDILRLKILLTKLAPLINLNDPNIQSEKEVIARYAELLHGSDFGGLVQIMTQAPISRNSLVLVKVSLNGLLAEQLNSEDFIYNLITEFDLRKPIYPLGPDLIDPLPDFDDFHV